MSWIQRNLVQDVTRWSPTGQDGFGNQTWSTPETIKGRWEERTELFVDTNGEEVRSEAVVFLTKDVDTGDYLYLGDTNTSDPTTLHDAREVKAFRKIPDLRARLFERRAML